MNDICKEIKSLITKCVIQKWRMPQKRFLTHCRKLLWKEKPMKVTNCLILFLWNIANLPPWDMDLGCDTSSWCGRHLYHVISKSFNVWQCYSLETDVSSKSSYQQKYLQTIKGTLTLEVGTWVIYKTRCIGVVDICAKLF
jgi:hypothetical protein